MVLEDTITDAEQTEKAGLKEKLLASALAVEAASEYALSRFGTTMLSTTAIMTSPLMLPYCYADLGFGAGTSITGAGAALLCSLEKLHIHTDQIRESILERILLRAMPISFVVVGTSAGISYALTRSSKETAEVSTTMLAGYGIIRGLSLFGQSIVNKIRKRNIHHRTIISRQIYHGTLAALTVVAPICTNYQEGRDSKRDELLTYCNGMELASKSLFTNFQHPRDVRAYFQKNMCIALAAQTETGVPAAELLAAAAIEKNYGDDWRFSRWDILRREKYFVGLATRIHETRDDRNAIIQRYKLNELVQHAESAYILQFGDSHDATR